jgi:cold shock CspA family protein
MMKRLEGIIVRFNKGAGYGFVAADGEEESKYFIHASQLPGNCDRDRMQGRRIRFTPVNTGKGPAVMKVELLEEEGG